MKKQVDARRLAQMMVGIGRRMDKRVQALITDMNQPLGYAIGNALEVMEVSQTLQNAGPADLTRLSLELAARMIYLGKVAAHARRSAGSGADQAAGRLGLPQAQGSDRGAGRQSAGAGSLRAAAQRHRRARDRFAARGLRQRHRCRIHRPGVGDDRRRTRHQGRLDRPGRGRDSRSEDRPEGGRGRVFCAACITPARSAWRKPRNWWRTRSAFPPPRRRSEL